VRATGTRRARRELTSRGTARSRSAMPAIDGRSDSCRTRWRPSQPVWI